MAMGVRSEELACNALRDAGYEILTRNYKTSRFEIDIIARHAAQLVFVEVRARRAGSMVHPLETINQHKRRRIILGAQHYVASHRLYNIQIRFDVVAVEWRGRDYRVQIFPNAF